MRLIFEQVETFKSEAGHSFGAQAEACVFGSRMDNDQCGFTLVELVMTIVIVGIIGAVVAPRFIDNNVFQSRGFADQVQASLRYAQKSAIAQRRFVCAGFAINSITLTIGATPVCGTPLISPAGGPYVISAPAGITFSVLPFDFSFNALGRPSVGQTLGVNGSANQIIIEAETGYVHSP